MIDYETFCKIKHYHAQAHLRISQIARTLGLHPRTVAYWLSATRYRRKPSGPRASKLDPFKPQIVRLLETHPLSRTADLPAPARGRLSGRLFDRESLCA